ncbi:MAG: aminoacyl-tRNA hydrolase [Flavobacteriaceae bacterium]|jgi:ribosome-associated protein|nr:aminoacyl-tRNA hydrolase [Flavobacteriaceae bacterium]
MKREVIKQELMFKAIRSSGAGGQHVNKVSSKVVLTWDLKASEGLTVEEKEYLLIRLDNRLNKEKTLQLEVDQRRSQIKNKEIAILRFFEIVEKGLTKPKERKETKMPNSIKRKRAENKQKASLKKALRQRPKL